ncbi:MAG: pyridoxamine 5'-phosphate oxidase family protein [Vicinamibacterales bacterium]|nr:pyridoxamine 5'-phosphate oxidase family protein [Vicinamibacterales bacterium]
MTEAYHSGEIAIQERVGVRDEALLNGRVIAREIPIAARPFVRQQATVALGWTDGAGNPWASLVVAEPGFASSNEAGTAVTLELPEPSVALMTALDGGRAASALGLVFIDLSTRRRLRANGMVTRAIAGVLRLDVEQAYPNCPKYIQRRERVEAGTPQSGPAVSTGEGVPDDLSAWLARTDTAFVASAGPGGSIDCSHRGGRAGFMHLDGQEVHVPDYAGNSMFCTLGNMLVEPRAGLALVDFTTRRQLHLTGDVTLEVSSSHDGETGRAWRLRPRAWAVSPLPAAVAWRLVDESPFNPPIA